MVDEGGRKRGDHSGGEDRPEPERQVGGSEWLLQQLSNGRLKSIFDAPRQAPSSDSSEREDPVATGSEPIAASGDAAAASVEGAQVDAEESVRPEPPTESSAVTADEASTSSEERTDPETGPERPGAAELPEAEAEGSESAPVASDAAGAPQTADPVDVPSSDEGGAPAEEAAPESDGDDQARGRSEGPLPLGRVVPQDPGSASSGRGERPESADARAVASPVAPPRVAPSPTPPITPPAVVPPTVTSAPVPPIAPPPAASPAARPSTSPASASTDGRPSAPALRRQEPTRSPSRVDRPEGATPPTPREPEPASTVYHWPDPRGGWDAPPVWEDIVAVPDDIDDDGGDEELWRETAGAYAWNLEPSETDADDDSVREEKVADDPVDAQPGQRETPAAAAPFTTAPATAHINSAANRKQAVRSKPRRGAGAPIVASAAPESARTPAVGKRRLVVGLIALGTVIVLAVIAAIGFAVASGGTHSEGNTPVASASSEAPTPSSTPEVPTVGPLPPGTWAWSALLGGECLQPFDSVWAEEFTVVDCSTAHSGEMVATGELAEAAFPGQEALATSVASLCQAQGVVDMTGAASYGDVQVSGSFPATQEQWDSGERSYYCFVDRAGGGELLGSLVGSPAA